MEHNPYAVGAAVGQDDGDGPRASGPPRWLVVIGRAKFFEAALCAILVAFTAWIVIEASRHDVRFDLNEPMIQAFYLERFLGAPLLIALAIGIGRGLPRRRPWAVATQMGLSAVVAIGTIGAFDRLYFEVRFAHKAWPDEPARQAFMVAAAILKIVSGIAHAWIVLALFRVLRKIRKDAQASRPAVADQGEGEGEEIDHALFRFRRRPHRHAEAPAEATPEPEAAEGPSGVRLGFGGAMMVPALAVVLTAGSLSIVTGAVHLAIQSFAARPER